MKKFIVLFAVLVLALGVASGSALAGKFSYTSGIQVQNLSATTDANIMVDYYDKATGAIDTSVTDLVPAGGSVTYFPVGASSGFDGSVVISADQPVAAISNIHGDNFSANASYVGASAGSMSVNVPLLMKGNSGFDTWFNVQNTGTSSTTATVMYSDGTTDSMSISPGAAVTFDQGTDGLNHPKVFSAVVTSDNEPIAITVVEESSTIMFAYSGFAAGATNPVMPLVQAYNSGFTSGVQIQNAGGADTTVTVSYTPSLDGTACSETLNVPAGQSVTFALFAFAGTVPGEDCAAQTRFIGSAQVTANSGNEPLAIIVNQHNLPSEAGADNGEAYGAFDPANASDTVVMPLIMDRNSGYWTGVSVINAGSSTVTVNCTFEGTSYTATAILNPGEALADLQNNNISAGYVGSASCTAAGGSLFGIVNELGPSGNLDQLFTYEAINN
jgi:hypothetical protein